MYKKILTLMFLLPTSGLAQEISVIQPNWTASQNISTPGENSTLPQIAVVPINGNAVAMWKNTNADVIQTAVYSKLNNQWSTPINISAVKENTNVPTFAVNASGNMVAAWENAKQKTIQGAYFSMSEGKWSAPVNLSVAGPQIQAPSVAINEEGDAIVIWQNNYASLQTATYSNSNQTWAEPIDVGAQGYLTKALISLDDQGNAVAVWRTLLNRYLLQSATLKSAAPQWTPPVTISLSNGGPDMPQLATDKQGNTIVVWQDRPTSVYLILAAALKANTGEWMPAFQVSKAYLNARNPQVGIDEQGYAIIAWQGFNSTNTASSVYTSTFSFQDLSVSSPISIGNAGLANVILPSLAVDDLGHAIAGWKLDSGPTSTMSVALRTPDGIWRQAPPLSCPGNVFAPHVGISNTDAAVVWNFSENSITSVQASVHTEG